MSRSNPEDAGRASVPARAEQHKVLVLDDHPTVRSVLARVLHEHGYETLNAASVDEAVRLLTAKTVVTIILDVKLSGGRSNLELLGRIRQQSLLASAPIIVMTGVALSEDEQRTIGRICCTSRRDRRRWSASCIKSPRRKPATSASLVQTLVRVFGSRHHACDRLRQPFPIDIERSSDDGPAGNRDRYALVKRSDNPAEPAKLRRTVISTRILCVIELAQRQVCNTARTSSSVQPSRAISCSTDSDRTSPFPLNSISTVKVIRRDLGGR